MKVKVCGITNKEDALKAIDLGAHAIGFIFYKKSPRYVSPFKVHKIIEALPPFVEPVGVFVNQNEGAVKDIMNFCGLKTIQLHGDETPIYCQRLRKFKVIKAFRINEGFEWGKILSFKTVASYLFDTYQDDQYGGSGKSFNWELLKTQEFDKPYILSGGLNAQNILQAVKLKPYALDVSSGVEDSPGKKSEKKLVEFFSVFKESSSAS